MSEHTLSEGEDSTEPPETVSGMFKSKSFWSTTDAKSARFKAAVPTTGTLVFDLWFKPCNTEQPIQIKTQTNNNNFF